MPRNCRDRYTPHLLFSLIAACLLSIAAPCGASALSSTNTNPTNETSPSSEQSEKDEELAHQLIYQAGVDDASGQGLTKSLGEAMRMAQEFPNDPKAHFELAVLYSRTNYLLEALKEVKIARNLLVEQNDPKFIQQTITNYEKQSKLNSKSLMAWYRLAMAYYLKGYALEKTKYGSQLQQPGDSPAGYYAKSKSAFQRALGLNARDIYSKNYLGYLVFENEKNTPQAIKLWKESLAVESNNNMAAYFLLANAYKKSGDLTNSFIYGAKALEIQSRLGMRPKS